MWYNPNYIEWGTSQGWRCPQCGRVYSPTTPMCFYCGGNQRTWTSPNTINPITTDDSAWWDEYLKQNSTGKSNKEFNSYTTASSVFDIHYPSYKDLNINPCNECMTDWLDAFQKDIKNQMEEL